jgi:hypothetical protein
MTEEAMCIGESGQLGYSIFQYLSADLRKTLAAFLNFTDAGVKLSNLVLQTK